jgi:hypothetical protein
LVAWRNRQKAFNRYKRATKEAIKNANAAHYHHHNMLAQNTVVAPTWGAAPVFGAQPGYGQTIISGAGYPAWGGATYLQGGYPLGASFLPAGAVYAGEQHEQQEGQYGDFTSYSSAGNAAQEVQQEEPEIRGTQV